MSRKTVKETINELGDIKSLLYSLLHGLLSGKQLLSPIRKHKSIALMLFIFCFVYMYCGFKRERLFQEKAALEKKVVDLRFISNTEAASLMYAKKKSEVVRKVRMNKINLEVASEPPYKLIVD